MFSDFSHRELHYGTAEAKKIYAIEHYTTTELLRIMKSENLDTLVDLVGSDHIGLLLTEEEVKDAKQDFDAAIAAGVDLEDVAWLSKEAVERVNSHPLMFLKMAVMISLGTWCFLFRLETSRTQPVASQTRN